LANRDIFSDLIDDHGFEDELRTGLANLEARGVSGLLAGHIPLSESCAA
jgi:hypothetical protein